MFDTSLLTGGVKTLASKFNYGHHPSIIMWSNGPKPEKDDSGFLSGITSAATNLLEPLLGKDEAESFNTFKFDAMVKEEHSAESIVTKFPVSSGFLVSDHVIKQNRVLKLTAIAANMQNSALWSASIQGLSVATGAIFNSPIIPIIGGIAGGIASAFETSDRIQSTYELFNTFRGTGQKLYISTILGPYLNCVVTSLRTMHDKNTSSILAIEITLEELQVIGEDEQAKAARKAMESMHDYSDFAKIAQSMAIGVLGGAPLPGLGKHGDKPSKQLTELKAKLAKLQAPVSSVKGRVL